MAAYEHYSASPGFDASEGLLIANEVAKGLGVRTATVLRWARNGDMPYLRLPGGDWRFSAKWLREYRERTNGK